MNLKKFQNLDITTVPFFRDQIKVPDFYPVLDALIKGKNNRAAYFSAAPIVMEYSKFSVFLGRIESVHFPVAPGTV